MAPPIFSTDASRMLFQKKKVVDRPGKSGTMTEKKNKLRKRVHVSQELIKGTKEYLQNTTLHGLRYVGADDLPLAERLFWMVAFIFGIMAAAYFITILYGRWNHSPMIISLSPVATPITSIPFPSITICNMNGAMKRVAEEIVSNEHNDSRAFFEKYMLKEVCGERMSNPESPLDALDVEWSQIEEFLYRVSQPCHKMMIFCKWKGKSYSCSDLFSTELTDDGMCCTFNQLDQKLIFRNHNRMLTRGMNFTYPGQTIEWSPESGYPEGASENTYPFRPIGTGTTVGLSVVLDAALHDYYCSTTASTGFKLVLHNPIETPKIAAFSDYVSPGFETRVEIRPKITFSTRNVFGIPQAKRRCYFTQERDLRYFKTYTQRNCELECQSNVTYKHCKCIPFYLPKDDTIRICGTRDIDCVMKVKEFFNHLMDEDESMHAKHVEKCVDRCSCLPGCVQVQYNEHMSTGKLEDLFIVRPNFLNGRNLSYYKKNIAIVHFFFMENSFTPFEKEEIFGFTDFLSNIGGLLGLFLGFSFMSAAEILYFLSLRILCKKGSSGVAPKNTVPPPRRPFLL